MTHKSEGLSPWGMPYIEKLSIAPGKIPDATLALPGSKSYTNRALLIAALADGASTLKSPLFSDDSYWCVDSLSKIGVNIKSDPDNETIQIKGGMPFSSKQDIFIGSAGTLARFLPGLIAARGKHNMTLTATEQLSKRPMTELVDALRKLGAIIKIPEDETSFPMVIEGGSLTGGNVNITGKKSSQFISGLLLAAPLAQKQVTINVIDDTVQKDYLRITLDLMKTFGVEVDHDATLKHFSIYPQAYQPCETKLEADASTATYFFALAAATGGRITLTNLNPTTCQPDIKFLDHLKKMGCKIQHNKGRITLQGPKILKGGQSFDLNSCSDSTPALAAIAPFADAPIEIHNVAHIRTHESDRIHVICENLKRAGVEVEEFDDGLRISPPLNGLQHTTINPHDDHRIAMGFTVMGIAGNGVDITNPACVSKTCPAYFDMLKTLGVKVSTSHA